MATMYPWEFDDDTEGTGDQPHAYTVRNNPYAHDVEVADAFDVGLDFTNGTDFTQRGRWQTSTSPARSSRRK
ncbi:MAG: hypothetical protein U5J97_02090 [Trueperaceae bacterium]|nr:hypothetical protein [Trueperaceae bacterium]